MIALTQEKREELVSRLKIYIRTTETAIKAGLATEEDLFNLEVRKIALAALTAEKRATVDVVGVIWNEWKPDVGTFLFTAPPVPEIKFPEKPDYSGEFTSFKDPVSAYKDGVVDGHKWYEKAFKRLNGWGE